MPRFLLLCACGLALSAATTAGQDVFRAGVDLVRLPVVVLDSQGVPVTGLDRDDFEVVEEGEPRPIVSFSAGAPGDAVPLHLGLMLDRSESMQLDFDAASRAAIDFVDLLDEARDVTFVEFDERVRIGRFTPSNYLRLFERIRNPELGLRTMLYDAMARYLDTTLSRPGQHVLVLYTDGEDSGSGLVASDVSTLLRFGTVLVYVVGYVDHANGVAQMRQRALLESFAHETGGEAFFPRSGDDVRRIYERIRREIDSRYTLGIVPGPAAGQDGFRRVDVRLRHATSGVRVLTRSGYTLPTPP